MGQVYWLESALDDWKDVRDFVARILRPTPSGWQLKSPQPLECWPTFPGCVEKKRHSNQQRFSRVQRSSTQSMPLAVPKAIASFPRRLQPRLHARLPHFVAFVSF